MSEAVEVTATAVQLESQSTSLGKVMQTRQIAELPVLGRSAMQLMSSFQEFNLPAGETVTGSGETYEVKMAGVCKLKMACLPMGAKVVLRSIRNLPLRYRSSPFQSFVSIPPPTRRSMAAPREES